MDQSERKSPAATITELRTLLSGVNSALTMDELRSIFYRGNTLAKDYPDDAGVQAQFSELKRQIVARGNAIQQGIVPTQTGQGAAPSGGSGTAPTAETGGPTPPPSVGDEHLPSYGIMTPGSTDAIPTAGFDVSGFRLAQPPPPPKESPGEFEVPFPEVAPRLPAQFPSGVPAKPRTPTPQQPFLRTPTPQQPFARTPTPQEPFRRTPTPQQPMAAGSQAGARTDTPSGTPASPGAKRKSSVLPLLVVGGLVWACVLGFGAYWFFFLRQPTTPGLFSVEFVTNPPGAAIRINHELRGNSNLRLDLPAGEHKLEVVLDGYEPAVSSVIVGPGQPGIVNLQLVPRPQTVRFFTDLSDGSVVLDGKPAGQLVEGQLVLESVAPGPHTVRVAGGRSDVSFSFELTPGQAPTLTSPINATNILAVIVSNVGKTAFARSSQLPMQVGLNGRQVGEIGADGLVLNDILPGDHELTLGSGSGARKLVVSFGPNPVLTAFLKLDANAGTLIVVTGEDDTSISLNGRVYRAKTRRGMIRIPNLAVRDYTVLVSKDGFERPPAQVASVRKGEETRLEFALKPVEKMAALRIRGGAAGTSVLIDGDAAGSIGGDGSLSLGNIVPGDHTIELRRDRHQPVRLQKHFPAGNTVELTGTEVAMERLPATLRLQLSPADSRVVLRPANQRGGERVIRETSVAVPEGPWTLTASAPGHTERIATIQVGAGETQTVDLRLTRQTTVRAPQPIGMEGWEQPGKWTQSGSWLVQRGGDYALFGQSPTSGVFTFTATILRGGRLQWVVDYKDNRNYVLLQMDDDDYWRKIVENGRTRELFKAKHGVDKKQGYFTVSVDVTAHALTQKLYKNGTWGVLDSWTASDVDFTGGKFGFYIPGNDEIGLSNFTYTPRP